jgi:hypothetical protein
MGVGDGRRPLSCTLRLFDNLDVEALRQIGGGVRPAKREGGSGKFPLRMPNGSLTRGDTRQVRLRP